VGDREGDSFHSPDVQRDRIEGICRDHKWRRANTFEELDESGRLPLLRRTGLLRAVEAIEAGRAQVVGGCLL
jgi:DNA invertase Pin-like site-specific DNA recombinase